MKADNLKKAQLVFFLKNNPECRVIEDVGIYYERYYSCGGRKVYGSTFNAVKDYLVEENREYSNGCLRKIIWKAK